MSLENESLGFSTNIIHVGQNPEKWDSRAVAPPIVMSCTFQQVTPGFCEKEDMEYGRDSNPTRNTLEECLATVENAKYCVTFGSGVGAVSSMSYLLKAGDHVIVSDNVYGGTNAFFRHFITRFAVETTFVDTTDLDATKKAFKNNTTMVWFDSPSNPLLKIVDIKAVVDMARKNNPKTLVIVDNTFATGYFQRPLDFGADIVMNSLTKYLNGHSDVIMGAVMLNDQGLYEKIKQIQVIVGTIPSPFDCYLVIRGLKTLELRMNQHAKNGLAVARFLEKNPRVLKVFHPGLESHPQHELFKRQLKGFGGMISMYVNGNLEETTNFVKSLKIFTLAVSLGGFESLVEIPTLMTRRYIPQEEKDQLGITDNLVRFSVGLEDVDDLIKDLEQALIKAVSIKKTLIKTPPEF